MPSTSTLLIALLLAYQAPAKDEEPDPEPPKPQAIAAKLVAKKKTYKLDLGGRTPAKFRDAVKAGGANLPAPVSVDLVLVITNNTKNDIRIRTTGTTSRVSLNVSGPNVVSAMFTEAVAKGAREPLNYAVLKPKQSVEIPLGQLVSKKATRSFTRHYWTEPGEYTLSAEFYTLVSKNWMAPAAFKDKDGIKGGGVAVGSSQYMTLKTRAIKVKVEK
jgi:hypothetical protein